LVAALSFDIPLIVNELFEFIGMLAPFSGKVIFTPPIVLVVFVVGLETVVFCAKALKLLAELAYENINISINKPLQITPNSFIIFIFD
jgi:hypothetical protein